MKRALILIAALIVFALLLAAVGALLLPVEHTAAVRVTLQQPPAAVYGAVTDVATATRWRTGLDSVSIVSAGPPLRWRESSSMGTIEFARTEERAPSHVVAEIQGAKEQGFGGTWTWEIVPQAGGGSVVTITERGAIYNPLFRLVSRITGPYGTLEQYARDLAALFGTKTAPVERVP